MIGKEHLIETETFEPDDSLDQHVYRFVGVQHDAEHARCNTPVADSFPK
ncbi:hypothetical protein [Mycobacterium sp. 3519A]|nr:hypothetical protein [Mycobacterium sp. 3519A]